MASILRQSIRRGGLAANFTGNLLWKNTKIFTPWLRPMAAIAAKDGESFWDKNKRLERPISPHMTIYKWEITANMSLAHRTTGIIMTSGLYSFAIAALMLPAGSIAQYLNCLQHAHLSPALVFAAKFAIAFPLMFHLCSGIRHLIWDSGKGFTIKSVYASGYAAIGAAVALTALVTTL